MYVNICYRSCLTIFGAHNRHTFCYFLKNRIFGIFHFFYTQCTHKNFGVPGGCKSIVNVKNLPHVLVCLEGVHIMLWNFRCMLGILIEIVSQFIMHPTGTLFAIFWKMWFSGFLIFFARSARNARIKKFACSIYRRALKISTAYKNIKNSLL